MSLLPPAFQLDVYTHGFRVSRFNGDTKHLIHEYCRRYAEWGMTNNNGRIGREVKKVYVTATSTRHEFFFIRGMLDEFLEYCKFHRINPEMIRRVDHDPYVPAHCDFDWDESKQPRDYQVAITDFVLNPLPIVKVSTLQTGKGKSLTSMYVIHRLKQRTVLILPTKFMDQWVKGLMSQLKLKKGELVTVTGAKAMKRIIEIFADEEEAAESIKIIVISSTTFRMYMRTYLDFPGAFKNYGYKVEPYNFFQLVKAGLRLVDEVHLFFHFNVLLDCMTHVPKSLSLSATLVSENRLTQKLYGMMFPPETRAPEPDYDRYIDVYVMTYRFASPQLIRYTNVFRQYQQSKFEKSIMMYKQIFKNYVDMLCTLTKTRFLDKWEKGQKLAIFCGTVKMVQAVVDRLKAQYPDVKVGRFIDVDPDSVLADSDIIVTTLQSCGTGKDIVGLRVVINTIGLSKMDTNQQMIGRLRNLVGWPDITPEFIYIGDRDNPKHAGYLQELPRKLQGKIRNLNTLTSTFVI